MPMTRFALAIALMGATAQIACSSSNDPLARQNYNDGEIAQVLTTSSQGEIEQSTAAESKVFNTEVQDFARSMVEEHTSLMGRQSRLFAQLGIQPVSSALSDQLRADSQRMIARLNSADRSTADDTYITSQIEVHSKMLNIIDAKLVPSVSNADLRKELDYERATISVDLVRAEQIQAALRGLDGGLGTDSGTGFGTDAGTGGAGGSGGSMPDAGGVLGAGGSGPSVGSGGAGY